MAGSWTIAFLGVAALLCVPSAHCQLQGNCPTNLPETGVGSRCPSESSSNPSDATIVNPTTTVLSQNVEATTSTDNEDNDNNDDKTVSSLVATTPPPPRPSSTSSSTDAPSSTSASISSISSPATTASSPSQGVMNTSSVPPSHSSTIMTEASTSIPMPSKPSRDSTETDSSTTNNQEQSSASSPVRPPTTTDDVSSPSETPPPSTTAAGALDSATIIGIVLGVAASLIVFAMVVLVVSVCCFCKRKEKSGSHSFVGSQGVTGDARMYETPSDVLSGSNGVDPVAYATSNTLRYVEQADFAKVTGSDVLTGSLRGEVRPHSSNLPEIAEPQEYETVRSSNSHNPPGTDIPMYEEPRDSMIRYRQSQELEESMQQPYEVPVRTSSYEGQSPTLSASMNGTEPLNRFSLSHRTASESQASPLINSNPSPSFRNIPSPYAEPVVTSTKNVPDDDHPYFVLEKGRAEQQPSNDDEPFYFELENRGQATTEPGQEENDSENLYAEVKKKDEDEHETDHSDLQVNGSSDVTEGRHHEEERHQDEETPSGTNKNEDMTERSNSQGDGSGTTEERNHERGVSSGQDKKEKMTEQSNLENNGSVATGERHNEGEVSPGPEEHLYFVIEKN